MTKCNVLMGAIGIPTGMTAVEVFMQKISAYRAIPQPKLMRPCDMVAVFVNGTFSSVIQEDVMAFAIDFFMIDEHDAPRRFTVGDYATALFAGYYYLHSKSDLEDLFQEVLNGVSIILGGAQNTAPLDALLSVIDRKNLSTALLEIAQDYSLFGDGILAKALLEIGFNFEEITTFLKLEKVSMGDILKELFHINNDLPQVVQTLNMPWMFPCNSDAERRNEIFQLIWCDVYFQKNLSLVSPIFEILGFKDLSSTVALLKNVLHATVSQVVALLKIKEYDNTNLVLGILKEFTTPTMSLSDKVRLVVDILRDLGNISAVEVTHIVISSAHFFEKAEILCVIGSILKDLEFSAGEIVFALKQQGVNAGTIINHLKILGFSVDAIIDAMEDNYFQAPEIAEGLWKIAANSSIILDLLLHYVTTSSQISDSAIEEIVDLLQQIKMSTGEVIQALLSYNIELNQVMRILKHIDVRLQELIEPLHIQCEIESHIDNKIITGQILPKDLDIVVIVEKKLIPLVKPNGQWHVDVSEVRLSNGIYDVKVMSHGYLLCSKKLAVVEDTYFIFKSVEDIVNSELSLQDKVSILMDLGESLIHIFALLGVEDPELFGRALGRGFVHNPLLDLHTLLLDFHGVDAHVTGIIVGNLLFVLERQSFIQLESGEQVRFYLEATGLKDHDLWIALGEALQILTIPNAQNITITIPLRGHNNLEDLVLQRNLVELVPNDNASFRYSLGDFHPIGHVMLHDTILTYDPRALLTLRRLQDRVQYVVRNLKGQYTIGEIIIELEVADMRLISG